MMYSNIGLTCRETLPLRLTLQPPILIVWQVGAGICAAVRLHPSQVLPAQAQLHPQAREGEFSCGHPHGDTAPYTSSHRRQGGLVLKRERERLTDRLQQHSAGL